MKETKHVPLKIKSIAEDGTFEGLASVYGNIDLGGDVVEKGAFKKTLAERGDTVPILWQHKEDRPIGLGELTDSPEGLIIKGQLDLDVQDGREAYSRLKKKIVRGLSIGFQSVKDEMKSGVRHLREIKLWEVSVVTFPMNEMAQVSAVKAASGAKDFNSEFADRQTFAARYQMEGAMSDALDKVVFDGTKSAEERITAVGEIIDQFKEAYVGMLPNFIALFDARMEYWTAQAKLELKAGRRISEATRTAITGAIEKFSNAMTELQALLDEDAANATDEKAAAEQTVEPTPAPEVPVTPVPDHLTFLSELARDIRAA